MILSGGNVDLGILPGLIRRNETKAGRRLILLVLVTDRPGGLADLLRIFGEQGANLVEVEHVREGLDLHVRETGVQAVLEVRGRDHAAAVLAAARRRRVPRRRGRPRPDPPPAARRSTPGGRTLGPSQAHVHKRRLPATFLHVRS